MAHIIIGTAGHIDHGKTTLVKALTGIDTDRLAEEKARGISIELGFAHLELPGGITAAIVDVPGHERFIKNMLAGAAGIDMALLVVAADEGIMPQTAEHMDILKLLEIKKIIVVITKIDLVDDEYLELVREDIGKLLTGTRYEDAPILELSALRGRGLAELKELLAEAARNKVETGRTRAPARLPIDRAFIMQGFGTVVTGTLFDGEINIGDTLEIAVKEKRFRVRNLQVHNQAVAKAVAGQRVAVNLAGVGPGELEKGDVLGVPGWFEPTVRVDVSCHLLPSSPWKLQPNTRVRFYQGTKEAFGRVVLFDRAELAAGEEAYLQIALEEPLLVCRGDNYIIRSYSPSVTVGGGRIVEPLAAKHKKKEAGLLAELEIKASGDLDRIAQLLIEKNKKPTAVPALSRRLGLPAEDTEPVLARLTGARKIVRLGSGEEALYLSASKLEEGEKLISREIKGHLEKFPLEPGLNKEALRAKFWPDMALKEYNALIQYWIERKVLALRESQFLVPAGYERSVGGVWAEKIAAVEQYYLRSRWQIAGWEKIRLDLNLDQKTGQQVLQYLLRAQKLYPLAEDLYLWQTLLDEAKQKIREWLKDNGQITVAQARDLLGTNRRIAVPLMEYLDKLKFTVRNGEARKLAGKGQAE